MNQPHQLNGLNKIKGLYQKFLPFGKQNIELKHYYIAAETIGLDPRGL